MSSMRLMSNDTLPCSRSRPQADAKLRSPHRRDNRGSPNAIVVTIKAAELQLPIADRRAIPRVETVEAVVARVYLSTPSASVPTRRGM